jgi:chorismate mutase
MNPLLNFALGQSLQERFRLIAKIAVIKNATHGGILTYMQFNIIIILTHFIVI